MPNIYATDAEAVITANKYLAVCINQANKISENSSFVVLDDAKQALNEAKGIYHTLECLGLLLDGSRSGEDITRISEKQLDIMEEKRRKIWKR